MGDGKTEVQEAEEALLRVVADLDVLEERWRSLPAEIRAKRPDIEAIFSSTDTRPGRDD